MQQHQESVTFLMIKKLPHLIQKFISLPAILAEIVEIPQFLSLSVYFSQRESGVSFQKQKQKLRSS